MELSREEKIACKEMIPSFKEMGEAIMLEADVDGSEITGEYYIRIARLLERLLAE